MNKLFIVIALILYFAIPCAAGQYKVIRVIDGDTIDILYHGKKERIRMLCVDTPESVHPDKSKNSEMGKKASNYTKSRLSGKYIDLIFEKRKRGKYGRLLAYVIINDTNFNLELVRNCWSPYYTKYGNSEKYHVIFLAAENEAKKICPNIWNKRQSQNSAKNKISGGLSPAINSTLNGNSAPIDAFKSNLNPAIGNGAYNGNNKSKKFHKAGCRYYNCKSCTSHFNSRQAAINAGFIPCKVCKP